MEGKREGSLYKIIEIAGEVFPIRYGYYSEGERELWDVTPVYPDFMTHPRYTGEGKPFATAYQDTCLHYHPKEKVSGENWCNDCKHFQLGQECIGVCHCTQRQIVNQTSQEVN